MKLARRPLKEKRHRYMKDVRQLMKAAGANAVGALLVFLDLLEGQFESVRQLHLSQVEHESTHADAGTNVVVYRVRPPAHRHPRYRPRRSLSKRQYKFCVNAAPQHTPRQIAAPISGQGGCGWRGIFRRKDCSMEYAVTAAFLLSVVAGSFAAVILGGYGIAQLIVSAL
jgi:hypothetical protein